jgi:hypothetical protein
MNESSRRLYPVDVGFGLVADRSNSGVAHALREGIARVASAPAILLGTFAILRLLDLPSDDAAPLVGGVRATIVEWLFWSFAYGGVLDRYARNRPTRGPGFFAASGRHVMALARLGLVPLVVVYALIRIPHSFAAGTAVLIFLNVVVGFARIRLVVEDRRSALGAFLGSVRFIRRNVVAVAALVASYGILTYLLHVVDNRFRVPAAATWASGAADETLFAAAVFLGLAGYASGIVLFQSRLAHASYTAAPPLEWPESPAAEAIANAAPLTTS